MIFQNTRDKKKIPNACRESEGIKIQFAYKESEIRRALIFSTVILKTSLYVFRFTENSSPPGSLRSNHPSGVRVEQRYV